VDSDGHNTTNFRAAHGFAAMIAKPYLRSELLRIVKKVLEKTGCAMIRAAIA
jgi:hypothetical protein